MDQDTQKIIEDRFRELPEQIREVITESGWEKTIRNIVSKNGLRIDQGSVIEHETLLIMLGFETPEDYLNNLINEAEIKPEIASKIAQEVSDQIFSLIRAKIIEKTESEEVEEIHQQKTKAETNLERENILKEIEDPEENQVKPNNSLMIEPDVQTPSTSVNTPEQNQKIIEQDMKKTSPSVNNVAQKLQNPTVSAAKTVKIDPYREIPE